MRKRDPKGRRTFLFSLGASLFLLITVLGIATVDYQGRRLSFGDDTLPLHVEDRPGGGTDLEVKLLGIDKRVDITKIDEFWNFLLDFGCIPHK